MGIPKAILVILMRGSFSDKSLAKKEAVASPAVVGLVARMTSSILSPWSRVKSLPIFKSSGPIPSKGERTP